MAAGIRVRHARSCNSKNGGRCSCKPTFQAQAYDAQAGRQVWRTFPTISAAKLWRSDAQVALRKGTLRAPTAKTVSEAAEQLIKGAHDGSILDRSGKPYKPSTARGYEQMLRAYILPVLGPRKLSSVLRRDIQDFADELREQGLSPSTINNIVDPLRVIFRRAIRRDEIAVDPTNDLDMPAIRGRRDRIEPPEKAHELLAALPASEKAFWATALFCGLRRGELRGLQWLHVDFDKGVIRVERSWDPVKGPVDVKTGAGHRAVPMAFVVRRELQAHQQRTDRDGEDLVFGRTATEAFFASTIRARANKAWKGAGPSTRSRRTRPVTAPSATSSPPAWTGSRSPPGPVTATSDRRGIATAISSPAERQEAADEAQCLPRSRRNRLWRTLWRTPLKTRKPP